MYFCDFGFLLCELNELIHSWYNEENERFFNDIYCMSLSVTSKNRPSTSSVFFIFILRNVTL